MFLPGIRLGGASSIIDKILPAGLKTSDVTAGF
jgi:hypothetical protein